MRKISIITAIAVIICFFALSLFLYFIFSAGYEDTLETCIKDTSRSEVYKPPFTYGDDYISAFLTGCIGFTVTLLCIYIFGRFVRKKYDT